MDVASSLVGLVAFALTFTKIICRTLSNISDGPEQLRQAVAGLLQLQHMFTRLKILQPRVDTSTLRELIAEYNRGIRSFQNIIERLQKLQSDSQARRIWQIVKITLKEKEVERIHGFVLYHVSALSAHMAFFERSVKSTLFKLRVMTAT